MVAGKKTTTGKNTCRNGRKNKGKFPGLGLAIIIGNSGGQKPERRHYQMEERINESRSTVSSFSQKGCDKRSSKHHSI